MKYLYFIFFTLLIFISCKNNHQKETKINELINNLEDSKNDEIIVVAHRGDWRNAPENSLQAIQYCIDIGVDMVEIDVQETKDGHLVLMHDETIDRTTNGKGLLSDWTLDSLQMLYLKDGSGVVTSHKIPTLKEALLLAKDKILVNLDKSYPIFNKCYDIMKETETIHQVIVKGRKTLNEVQNEFGQFLDEVYFMPVIELPDSNSSKIIEDYISTGNTVAIEFVFKYDSLKTIKEFSNFRDRGTSVWVNSLWPWLNGGNDDEKASLDVRTYNWYLKNNVDIIQTDRPRLLLNYLREKGYHN